jgi:hypothetical protein
MLPVRLKSITLLILPLLETAQPLILKSQKQTTMNNTINPTLLCIYLLLLAEFSLAEPWSETFYVLDMQAGDVACYVDTQNNNGDRQQVMAVFEICEQRQFIGKHVVGFFEQANVLAASCEGDMDCGESDTVDLITALQVVDEPVQDAQAAESVASHCFSNEQVIFSCNTHANKVISICAPQNTNPKQGYMQYRFGSSGYFPEFIYPSNHDTAQKFFYSGNLTYSGGGGAYLKFMNAGYTYVVYTGIGRGWEQEGLVISDGIDEIASYTCKGPWTSEIGPDLFSQLSLKTDPDGFGIPVD